MFVISRVFFCNQMMLNKKHFSRKKNYDNLLLTMLTKFSKRTFSLKKKNKNITGVWFLWLWYNSLSKNMVGLNTVTFFNHNLEFDHLHGLCFGFARVIRQMYVYLCESYAFSLFSLLNNDEVYWMDINMRQVGFLYEYLMCLIFIKVSQCNRAI